MVQKLVMRVNGRITNCFLHCIAVSHSFALIVIFFHSSDLVFSMHLPLLELYSSCCSEYILITASNTGRYLWTFFNQRLLPTGSSNSLLSGVKFSTNRHTPVNGWNRYMGSLKLLIIMGRQCGWKWVPFSCEFNILY